MRELSETRDPMGRLEPNKNVPVMNALGYSVWQTLRNLIYRITLSWNNGNVNASVGVQDYSDGGI